MAEDSARHDDHCPRLAQMKRTSTRLGLGNTPPAAQEHLCSPPAVLMMSVAGLDSDHEKDSLVYQELIAAATPAAAAASQLDLFADRQLQLTVEEVPQATENRQACWVSSPPRAAASKSPDIGASMSSVYSARALIRPGLKKTSTAWNLSSKKNGGPEAAAQARPRRHPAGRGRHRLPRGGQRRATARCLP